MKQETAYLTQYCNLCIELKSTGQTFDTANESQQVLFQELRAKAIEQSGLTCSELTLISMCRKYGLFLKINTYAHKIKNVCRLNM